MLEVCVETIDEAIAAAEAGAGRLELCACMSEAGTTPSTGFVAAALERVDIPVFVMIRPRGGDFTYTANELDVMNRDIDAMKRLGVHGIVSGVLEGSRAIDREATAALLDAASPLPFTFHRAFDLAPELERALDVLRTIGVHRVLTSGGASTAIVGAGAIARLARQAGRTQMLAGGGVRAPHVAELVRLAGVTEAHARPTRSTPRQRRPELDPAAVRAIVEALH